MSRYVKRKANGIRNECEKKRRFLMIFIHEWKFEFYIIDWVWWMRISQTDEISVFLHRIHSYLFIFHGTMNNVYWPLIFDSESEFQFRIYFPSPVEIESFCVYRLNIGFHLKLKEKILKWTSSIWVRGWR